MSKYIIFNTIVEYFYLFQILERNNVCVTGRKKSEFSDEDLTQDVDRLLHFEQTELRNSRLVPEMCLISPSHCMRSIIHYLEVMFSRFVLITTHSKGEENYVKAT